jgi:hypothetical protein
VQKLLDMPSIMKEIMVENEWYKISEDLYNDKLIEKGFSYLDE